MILLLMTWWHKKPWHQQQWCSWWRHQMEKKSRYWPFVRGIRRLPMNSPHKGQWRGALMFSLICVWTNGWANNRDAGDLRRHRAHYDVLVMWTSCSSSQRFNKPLQWDETSGTFDWNSYKWYWASLHDSSLYMYVISLYSLNEGSDE